MASSAGSTTSWTSSRKSPTRSSCTTSTGRRRPPSSSPGSSSSSALTKLRGFSGLERYWIEIHRLENEGDQVTRAAVAGLFSTTNQPVDIIKWKDVYALLETGIDRCEDVANIIEKIAIKHA